MEAENDEKAVDGRKSDSKIDDQLQAVNYSLSKDLGLMTPWLYTLYYGFTYSLQYLCLLVSWYIVESSIQLMQELAGDIKLVMETQEQLNQVQTYTSTHY